MPFQSYRTPIAEANRPLTGLNLSAGLTIPVGDNVLIGLDWEPWDAEPFPAISVTGAAGIDAALWGRDSLCVRAAAPGVYNVAVAAGGITGTVVVTAVDRASLTGAPAAPVKAPVRAATITTVPASMALTVLQQATIDAVIQPSHHNMGDLQWTSSDQMIAEVATTASNPSEAGVCLLGATALIRGLNRGTCDIVATIDGVTTTCSVTVS